MPVTSDFDRFFLHLPPLDREKDMTQFWKRSVNNLKKISIEPEFKQNKKRALSKFDFYDASFKSFNRTKISGELYSPKRTKRSKVVICIHDYNQTNPYNLRLLDDDMSYFFLKLRGHDKIVKKTDDTDSKEEEETPGYMIENILDKDNYYVKGVFLDTYRAIDALRLNRRLDCSSIGIIGKGLGAAAALFATAYSNRVGALVIDSPFFSYLAYGQNRSEGDTANEINTFILNHKNKKKQVKKNLTYFDALNFADMVTCPILTIVGLRDVISPPECVFALFNHLLTEKTIEVYPDEGNSAGGDNQFKKSISWIKKTIH